MKWSKTGVKTLKEVPADTALPSHALLVRGGFIKKLTSGIFTYGPFMVRAIHKFENIVREELNKKNCVEILMPMVQPTELWRQSERLHIYGDLLQKMKNRTGQEFCLGPTHEEVISNYIKNNINSYRDLPFCLYQIQNKFRDEIRPRFGLMRAREFIMKDAYSFDLNEEQAKESYKKMESVYQAIFSRLDIPFRAVKADSGEIGGDLSEEFHILAEHGEDELLFTDSFAANKEICPDVKPGDKGPDNQVLRSCRGIEVGHIFYLGDKYSKKMKLHYLDQQGNKQTVKMGCYGIGITRTIQAVVE
ncbi:MAG: proline--tRNA ligase, partial [Bdellovibrionales bacterium]|nr:proline--tRNA ligase [Bdellovibrionales bacterium]